MAGGPPASESRAAAPLVTGLPVSAGDRVAGEQDEGTARLGDAGQETSRGRPTALLWMPRRSLTRSPICPPNARSWRRLVAVGVDGEGDTVGGGLALADSARLTVRRDGD